MDSTRVLIVDDEANIRESMQFALEAVGYRVETAADGPDGLQKFGPGTGWDLVLLDQRMPGMEGLEVLRQMRERDPGARVLMVTAYASIELAVDAMKAGATDFLRKPFTPEVLRGAVQAALDQPRGPISEHGHSLTRLLLPTPPAPARARTAEPLIQFRTLNGYRFWHVPLPTGGEETESLRIRRAFEVRAPGGHTARCAVDLATSVRERVRLETDREYSPTDPLWDTVATSALSNYLWERAEFPPDVLVVYDLSREQLRVVRALAGMYPGSL